MLLLFTLRSLSVKLWTPVSWNLRILARASFLLHKSRFLTFASKMCPVVINQRDKLWSKLIYNLLFRYELVLNCYRASSKGHFLLYCSLYGCLLLRCSSFVGSDEFKYVSVLFISKIYIRILLHKYMSVIEKCRLMKN